MLFHLFTFPEVWINKQFERRQIVNELRICDCSVWYDAIENNHHFDFRTIRCVLLLLRLILFFSLFLLSMLWVIPFLCFDSLFPLGSFVSFLTTSGEDKNQMQTL